MSESTFSTAQAGSSGIKYDAFCRVVPDFSGASRARTCRILSDSGAADEAGLGERHNRGRSGQRTGQDY